jgi:hypothetical protein
MYWFCKKINYLFSEHLASCTLHPFDNFDDYAPIGTLFFVRFLFTARCAVLLISAFQSLLSLMRLLIANHYLQPALPVNPDSDNGRSDDADLKRCTQIFFLSAKISLNLHRPCAYNLLSSFFFSSLIIN